MVPKTIMVDETYTDTEMVPEVIHKQVPKMVPRTIEETIMVPQTVDKTIMVPKVIQEQIMVPKVVPRTVMEQATQQKTVMVPRTVMQPRCVQDHYTERRVLRFDPATGAQIGDGSPRHGSPFAAQTHNATHYAAMPPSPNS